LDVFEVEFADVATFVLLTGADVFELEVVGVHPKSPNVKASAKAAVIHRE